MKNIESFQQKETAIKKALETVQKRLSYLSENRENLTEEERENWNNWHDVEYRLKEKIWNNWSKFKDWNFEKHGYNTY